MNNRSKWTSLEVVKLGVAILTPVLLFWLGVVVSNSAQEIDRVFKALEKEKEQVSINQIAIQNFSKAIYERRARAELLSSSIIRNVSIEEIKYRKRLYDEAYFNWNANHQSNLLLVRKVLGNKEYSEFESMIEFHLVTKIFAPLDRCLTKAYDFRIQEGKSGKAIYRNCKGKVLLQQALDCGYALTDELYKLTYKQLDGERESAASIVAQRCSE
jgi:hypothetical protein